MPSVWYWVNPDTFAQKAGIGEARRADGCHIVGFGRGHDPCFAALPDLVEPPKDSGIGCEIGGDHRQALGLDHVVPDTARPRGQAADGAAQQPARVTRRIAPVAQRFAKVAHFCFGPFCPALQRIEIAR